MQLNINFTEHLLYSREKSDRRKPPLLKSLIALVLVMLFAGSLLWVRQWAGTLLILALLLGYIVVTKLDPRLRAQTNLKRGNYIGEMSIVIENSKMILRHRESEFSMDIRDLQNGLDFPHYFHFEHVLGFVFFIPKAQLSMEDLNLIRGVMAEYFSDEVKR